jgi:uncharacterized protein (DUF1697 family)
MPTHVALLRGVNVGGRKLAMADLREVVSSLGHTDASTYIQSGNALFTPAVPDAGSSALAAELEKAIAARLDMAVGVVVLSRDELSQVIGANPYPDVVDPKQLHAVVLADPPGAKLLERIAAAVAAARGRDTVQHAGRALYLHTPDGYGRSDLAQRLLRLLSPGIVATARNWSTMNTLLGRLNQ